LYLVRTTGKLMVTNRAASAARDVLADGGYLPPEYRLSNIHWRFPGRPSAIQQLMKTIAPART
jgi:hypothetical protein